MRRTYAYPEDVGMEQQDLGFTWERLLSCTHLWRCYRLFEFPESKKSQPSVLYRDISVIPARLQRSMSQPSSAESFLARLDDFWFAAIFTHRNHAVHELKCLLGLVLMLGGYRCILSASLFVGWGKSVSAFTIHRSVLIFESSENKICSSIGRGPADILSG